MFSQEFILQNHADILSCVCMVIFMLLIPQVSHARVAATYCMLRSKRVPTVQVTNPYASRLIFVHNNVSNLVEPKQGMYTYKALLYV